MSTHLTVGDLIALLQKCDPNDRVYSLYDSHMVNSVKGDNVWRVTADVVGPSKDATKPFLPKGVYVGVCEEDAPGLRHNLEDFWGVPGSDKIEEVTP